MKSAQLTNAAFLFATTGVLFSVACSEAGPTSPDPRSASGAVPHFAVQEPTRTSANASLVEVEWVKVCVTYPDRVGPAAKVEVVVDIGNKGQFDGYFPLMIDANSCREVWVHGGAVHDRVRVDLARGTVPGFTTSFVRVTDSRSFSPTSDNVTSSAETTGASDSGLVGSDRGTLIRFVLR